MAAQQLAGNSARALELAGRGIHIFPCCYPSDEDPSTCGCGSGHVGRDVGKAPIGKLAPHGVKDATTERKAVWVWWAAAPKANIGVDLARSALVFVDPDSAEAQREATAAGLPPTWFRRSRNDGYLYRRPAGVPTVNLIHSGASGHLDLMAGGYAIVHGRHASGCDVLLEDIGDLDDCPPWVVERLRARGAELGRLGELQAERSQLAGGNEPPVRLSARGLERWRGERVEQRNGKLDRSDSLYYLALALAEAGASVSAIAAALAERDATLGWSKFTDRRDAELRYREAAERAVAWAERPPDQKSSRRDGAPLSRAPMVGSDGAHGCLGCGERDAQLAERDARIRQLEQVCDVQRGRLVDLELKADANGQKLVSLAQFRKSTALAGKRPAIVEAIAIEIDAARKANRTSAKLYYGDRSAKKAGRDPGGIAGKTGVSPDTVGATVDELAAWDGCPWRFERIRDELGHQRVVVNFQLASNVEQDLAALAEMPREKRTHGGARPRRCPDHPNADLIVQTICADCGQIVDSSAARLNDESLTASCCQEEESAPLVSSYPGDSKVLSGFRPHQQDAVRETYDAVDDLIRRYREPESGFAEPACLDCRRPSPRGLTPCWRCVEQPAVIAGGSE